MGAPYRPLYRRALVVLADSSGPHTFCSVGAGQALIDYLGAGLLVVRDVLGELRRNQGACPGLRVVVQWLEASEEQRVHDLTHEHALEVGDLLRLYQLPGEHPREHLGEIATVYTAIELAEAGRQPLVCVDDQLGKKLCRGRRLAYADTPALLVEMVCEKAIDHRLGQRIWQALFPHQRALWARFRQRVDEACGARDAGSGA
jgi:hypothetical protein